MTKKRKALFVISCILMALVFFLGGFFVGRLGTTDKFKDKASISASALENRDLVHVNIRDTNFYTVYGAYPTDFYLDNLNGNNFQCILRDYEYNGFPSQYGLDNWFGDLLVTDKYGGTNPFIRRIELDFVLYGTDTNFIWVDCGYFSDIDNYEFEDFTLSRSLSSGSHSVTISFPSFENCLLSRFRVITANYSTISSLSMHINYYVSLDGASEILLDLPSYSPTVEYNSNLDWRYPFADANAGLNYRLPNEFINNQLLHITNSFDNSNSKLIDNVVSDDDYNSSGVGRWGFDLSDFISYGSIKTYAKSGDIVFYLPSTSYTGHTYSTLYNCDNDFVFKPVYDYMGNVLSSSLGIVFNTQYPFPSGSQIYNESALNQSTELLSYNLNSGYTSSDWRPVISIGAYGSRQIASHNSSAYISDVSNTLRKYNDYTLLIQSYPDLNAIESQNYTYAVAPDSFNVYLNGNRYGNSIVTTFPIYLNGVYTYKPLFYVEGLVYELSTYSNAYTFNGGSAFSMSNPFLPLIRAGNNFLSMEIFGNGFTIGSILSITFGFVLLGFVIKMFLGG